MLAHIFILIVTVHAVTSSGLSRLSELACSPQEIAPGESVQCLVYARDAVGEPTSQFDPYDITVSLTSQIPSVSVSSSEVQRSNDPSVLQFSVSATKGTTIRIDVRLRDSAVVIVNSGFVVTALTSPATTLRALKCDTSELVLRGSSTCECEAFGDNGVPAVVKPDEVVFFEPQNSGDFSFQSGKKKLRFVYSAPSQANSESPQTTISVRLANMDATLTWAFKLVYPTLPATVQSQLSCTDGLWCRLVAMDAQGPVQYTPNGFNVTFEAQSGDGSWYTTDAFTSSITPVSASTARVSFAPALPKLVFRARLSVTVHGQAVAGSPYSFTSGVAPTAETMSLVSCGKSYFASGATGFCRIAVAPGVTADPRFLTITPSSGEAGAPMFHDTNGTAYIVFPLFVGTYDRRTTLDISVSIDNEDIQNSPWKVVVYAAKQDKGETVEHTNLQSEEMLVGAVYFGTMFAMGATYFFMRQRELSRRRKILDEADEKEMEAVN